MIDMEVWRDIENWEGIYQISNKGRVKSFYGNGRIMSLSNCKGYNTVFLYQKNSSKRKRVCRLVAEAFIPNPENKPQVNHINGLTSDDSVNNLEWATASENLKHKYRFLGHPPTKARMRKVKAILPDKTEQIFESVRSAGRKLNGDSSAISKVCKGKNKHHMNIIFEYINK